jgi:predicted nucleic acid-binding protein
MTVLIDSWAWIEYWKGGKLAQSAAKYIEGEEEAIVSPINIAEIYHWISKYYNERTADTRISLVERRCYMIPVERDIAIEAAKIKKRNQLGLADSVILATARSVQGKLVTGDPDFKSVDNVILLA